MKKVRLLGTYEPDWTVKAGPPIGTSNDVYFLLQEPWLEVKNTSIEQCAKDRVIPWIRQGSCISALKECEKYGIQMILGPNVVFGCSDRPELNFNELHTHSVYRLLMNDNWNAAIAAKYSWHPENIRQVKYFMRPKLYEEPFFYEHVWDIYFHIKGDINIALRKAFPNFTATCHGFYKFEELKYKAQHSAVCVTSCWYENYGLAVHEISLLGCPLVYDFMSMKPGSVGEGMGVFCEDDHCSNTEKAIEAVKTCMKMDRLEVWKASRKFQDPESIKEMYRKALDI